MNNQSCCRDNANAQKSKEGKYTNIYTYIHMYISIYIHIFKYSKKLQLTKIRKGNYLQLAEVL